MPYIIETFDKPNHQEVRQQHRAAHLEYLDANKQLLLACGAKLQDDGKDAGGGLYIVDGHHRFVAYERASRQALPIRIRAMTKRRA